MLKPSKFCFTFLAIILVNFISFPIAFADNGKWKNKIKMNSPHSEKVSNYDWQEKARGWKKHTGANDCVLPPGLAKKGMTPPGWEKKCEDSSSEIYHEHEILPSPQYPSEPSVSGEVNVGIRVDLPFPHNNK